MSNVILYMKALIGNMSRSSSLDSPLPERWLGARPTSSIDDLYEISLTFTCPRVWGYLMHHQLLQLPAFTGFQKYKSNPLQMGAVNDPNGEPFIDT